MWAYVTLGTFTYPYRPVQWYNIPLVLDKSNAHMFYKCNALEIYLTVTSNIQALNLAKLQYSAVLQ